MKNFLIEALGFVLAGATVIAGNLVILYLTFHWHI